MKKIRAMRDPRLHTVVFLSLLCLVFCCLYFFVVYNRATVELNLEIHDAPKGSRVRIFFASGEQSWSELRSVAVHIRPGLVVYSFPLPSLRKVERLRIDTHNYAGEAKLSSFRMIQPGHTPIELNAAELSTRLHPLVAGTQIELQGKTVLVRSSDNDPQLEIFPQQGFVGQDWGILLPRFLVICCGVLLIWFGGRRLVPGVAFVPMLLFGVWCLALVMALQSRNNAHPDEYVHLAAQKYYESHWLPPAVDNPEIACTFSVYGNSRLSSKEIYYLFAGRFTRATAFLQLPSPLDRRAFQLFLLSLILLATMRSTCARLTALPLLLTSQSWYLFSYCNSDAFSLFMAWLVGWQVVDKESVLQRFLFYEGRWRILGVVLAGIGAGVVFMIKQNYLPFTVLVCLLLLLQLYREQRSKESTWMALRRLVAIGLIGAAFFGLRIGLDNYINDGQLAEKQLAMQRKYAQPAWHPDTPPEERIGSLGLRAKGVSWKQALRDKFWFEKSFRSGFGEFGYSCISGPVRWYNLVRWCAGAFFFFFFLYYFYRGNFAENITALGVLAFSAALIVVSFIHSWTMDFQPQGRYLFPILSMFALLCGLQGKVLERRLVLVPLTVLFVLGVWFFVFIGLSGIAKA
ncbi:hypothetical protein JWG39_10100 [Desulforhopalus vacuolatus]|uniref:hypothetical protein n=1 Tax=Desulforhopalus vacuolatus TaxID=40414 RepID=UPI001962D1BE|nr:hypothetical protein [Desulforhopalus vacuolatus]MBM9520166.1 hypothetical protein [Desulforhopalus vacuolatus]